MRGHIGLLIGICLLTLVAGLVIAGLFWLPADPNRIGGEKFAPPSLSHPMGTDWFGRDVFSRVLVGGRLSLRITLMAVVIGGAVGILLGLGGYYGGMWDEIGMRASDFLLSFPVVLLALLLSVSLGPGPVGVTIAIACFNVPAFARVARAGFLSLRDREYVLWARAVGASEARILWRHILPNISSPLLVQATVSLGGALLSEAALSYLGLGVQPPDPSWGRMLQEAQSSFFLSPWPAIFPGLVLALAVLGLNLMGDGLRDLLDPTLHRLATRNMGKLR